MSDVMFENFHVCLCVVRTLGRPEYRCHFDSSVTKQFSKLLFHQGFFTYVRERRQTNFRASLTLTSWLLHRLVMVRLTLCSDFQCCG